MKKLVEDVNSKILKCFIEDLEQASFNMDMEDSMYGNNPNSPDWHPEPTCDEFARYEKKLKKLKYKDWNSFLDDLDIIFSNPKCSAVLENIIREQLYECIRDDDDFIRSAFDVNVKVEREDDRIYQFTN